MPRMLPLILLAAATGCGPVPGGEPQIESSTKTYLNARGVPQSCTDQLTLSDINGIASAISDPYRSRNDAQNRIDFIVEKRCGRDRA
jgi:hypothetical protein